MLRMPAISEPRNLGGKTFVVGGQVPNGFADHLEVADDSIDCLLVGPELLETQTSYVLFDPGDRIEDVLDAEAPFSRRQQPPREGFCREAAA